MNIAKQKYLFVLLIVLVVSTNGKSLVDAALDSFEFRSSIEVVNPTRSIHAGDSFTLLVTFDYPKLARPVLFNPIEDAFASSFDLHSVHVRQSSMHGAEGAFQKTIFEYTLVGNRPGTYELGGFKYEVTDFKERQTLTIPKMELEIQPMRKGLPWKNLFGGLVVLVVLAVVFWLWSKYKCGKTQCAGSNQIDVIVCKWDALQSRIRNSESKDWSNDFFEWVRFGLVSQSNPTHQHIQLEAKPLDRMLRDLILVDKEREEQWRKMLEAWERFTYGGAGIAETSARNWMIFFKKYFNVKRDL
jgi:hypothetical protein